MTAEIISGTQVAAEIRAELKEKTAKLKADKGVVPGLVILRVGEDPASVSYVKGKEKACDEVGIYQETIVYPDDVDEKTVLDKLVELNNDPKYHGILVQLPLPKHISEDKVIDIIDPRKDVDGFHPVNVGKLLIGNPYFMPCTPAGIQQLLVRSGNDPAGKHVVICGRSNIVGKPILAIMLQKKDGANATVTMVHTGTKDTASVTRQADILIAAVGRPKVITADMVKEGVVVIDVGVNRVPDDTKKSGFRLVGDTDFEAIKEKAKAITPVPGGVGPMTITMLMWNTVNAAESASA
ncbi:MAG: bifunctional 5,10-methylene-tetrahydrofolate dehydrogenase/5,10-methylene-tetrahydrofolate cyclohydrolase [Chloroflexi bacterium]|jgi:methylenetetrahydrofolate dehydrogenase (NADP+) / methenyltetrahydrofolate cyclohydrolase|nr:bifunctional 5,10-methylene-tetrahydrofolate dehydrogenase/5,10-methylene-tetrahydrofolate cyclohydrolase [Chloroflexota bacterium]MBT7082194.1 bifunctional 5,10-methylene-tetrahydrofolate dehydrogenase/5,10-methylene-tetrahydrofolate cyclohydrolase [Chloroflexota bacterium]MBT7289911.1 bifunctional 5,10-methylene-tetrahydrofolate dehydrogenase/5,10-methylene-tetrahydrofolate cyclohydrolase [Chloroflexota bacterium]